MKLACIAVALLAGIAVGSAEPAHAKCNGQTYDLPIIGKLLTLCSDQTTRSCQFYCLQKKAGMFNPDNTFNLRNSLAVAQLFPDGLKKIFHDGVLECGKIAATWPAKLDEKCSEFDPLYKCGEDWLKKECKILELPFMI